MKLHNFTINWVFLLEHGINVVFFLIWNIRLFLHIDWINEHLRIVHGAPSNHTAMIGEGRKLISFYVLVDGLFYVKATAHKCNLNLYNNFFIHVKNMQTIRVGKKSTLALFFMFFTIGLGTEEKFRVTT